MALQPPPHLLTTLPAPAGGGRCVRPDIAAGVGREDELATIIAGTREDWSGGARTLTPRESIREPNGTLWVRGLSSIRTGDQAWLRTDEGAGGPPAAADT